MVISDMVHFTDKNDVIGNIEMGELRIDVPNELHKSLKRVALDKGISLKVLIPEIFSLYIKEQKRKEASPQKEDKFKSS
jgi:hypothetical protein